ncbi:MAG: family 16 glycoside hydrolase [Candidatus Brocadiia bacterium]
MDRSPAPRRRLAAMGLAAAALLALAADKPAKPFRPGQDGWLSLFDGSSLEDWEVGEGAEWKLRDGILAGSKGRILNYWHWKDFELEARIRGSGILRFRLSLAPMPDQPGYCLDLADATIRTPGGETVARGSAPEAKGWRELRLRAVGDQFTVWLDGAKVAEGRDERCPAKGMLVLVARGQPLQLARLRIRPLGREEHVNIPSPNTACYVCHANFQGEAISRTHQAESIGCAQCHGPSLAHRSDEDNVTAPDVMFLRGEVDPACLRCHKRHEPESEKKDGTGKPPPDPVCTDCHGAHQARN